MRMGGRRVFVVFIAGMAVTAWGVAKSAPRVPHNLTARDAFSRVITDERVVALTFDDGPDPAITPQALALLRRHGAHATFFVTGRRAESYPDIVRAMIRDGNELGNHTFNHRTLTSGVNVAEEIRLADDVFEMLGFGKPVMFRPPRGLSSGGVQRVAVSLGHRVVFWSLAVDRFALHESADRAARDLLGRVRPGDIILAHDCCKPFDRSKTLAVLVRFLPRLEALGYRIVSVSELLRIRVPSKTTSN